MQPISQSFHHSIVNEEVQQLPAVEAQQKLIMTAGLTSFEQSIVCTVQTTMQSIGDLFEQSVAALTQAASHVFGGDTLTSARAVAPVTTQDSVPSITTSVVTGAPIEEPPISANEPLLVELPADHADTIVVSMVASAAEIDQVAIPVIQGTDSGAEPSPVPPSPIQNEVPVQLCVQTVQETKEMTPHEARIHTAKTLMRTLQKSGFSGETEGLALRVLAQKGDAETPYIIEDRADPQIHVAIDGDKLFINGSDAFQDGLLESTIHFLQACVDFHKSGDTRSKEAVAALLSPLMLQRPRLQCLVTHKLPVDAFSSIHSSMLQPIPLARGEDLSQVVDPRSLFLAHDDEAAPVTLPPIIVHSEIVPREMVEHLMRHKQDNRCGRKFCQGDAITNAEGLLHQLVIPFVKAHITADILWHKDYRRFDADAGREVVINGSIHPDYEFNGNRSVMWALTCVSDTPREGRHLPSDFSILSTDEKQDAEKRAAYDEQILQHLTYHLLAKHTLPVFDEIPKSNILSLSQAKSMLERFIVEDHTNIHQAFQNMFVQVKTGTHSLEMLLNFYVLQLRNELGGLEALLPQGYVYTIDPPNIFAKTFDATLLNRLQCLACKWLLMNSSLEGLRVISCNDAAGDGDLIYLWKKVCCSMGVQVVPKLAIVPAPEEGIEVTGERLHGQFTKTDKDAFPVYAVYAPYALVLRSNGDAFGQHSEYEGRSGKYLSMEAVIGGLSSMACSLRRERKDLCDYMISDV